MKLCWAGTYILLLFLVSVRFKEGGCGLTKVIALRVQRAPLQEANIIEREIANILHSDMVVAAPTASFGLPEALRGIFAGAGGPPRLVRNVGIPIASEMALTGKPITAQRAKELNLVNRISPSQDTVVDEAVKLANEIAAISPDAAIVTRAALKEAWESGSVERATQLTIERYSEALNAGENALEGLSAFAQKRKPDWKPSKL